MHTFLLSVIPTPNTATQNTMPSPKMNTQLTIHIPWGLLSKYNCLCTQPHSAARQGMPDQPQFRSRMCLWPLGWVKVFIAWL